MNPELSFRARSALKPSFHLSRFFVFAEKAVTYISWLGRYPV